MGKGDKKETLVLILSDYEKLGQGKLLRKKTSGMCTGFTLLFRDGVRFKLFENLFILLLRLNGDAFD